MAVIVLDFEGLGGNTNTTNEYFLCGGFDFGSFCISKIFKTSTGQRPEITQTSVTKWPFPFPLELRLAASFLGAGTLPEARHGGLAETEVARPALGVELPWGT